MTVTRPPQFAVAVTAVVIVAVFSLMLVAERRWPLRRRVEGQFRRTVRNLATGTMALLVATLLQMPVLGPVANWVLSHRAGLLNVVPLPTAIHVVLAVLMLDYTLWIWHRANHLVPLLWRFHLVHHVDLDLDSSTALRFHFGEHVLSLVYRTAQIALIGASPLAVWIWQLMLFTSILFHHGNVAIPERWERRLVRILVTPRMHGIHHSERREEADTNWSSLFSWWDRLHRTMRLDIPQQEIVIGVPAYQDPRDVTLGRILALPFRRQRRDWEPSAPRIGRSLEAES